MAVEREPFAFSDEEMNGLKQNVNTLDDNISPHAVNLTQEEYRWIYRMGPQALPFVEETLRCATEYPEFSQAFMDVAKFEKDFNFSRQTEELASHKAFIWPGNMAWAKRSIYCRPKVKKISDKVGKVGNGAMAISASWHPHYLFAITYNV